MSEPTHSAEEQWLPECTACGFCCFFPDPRYVMVFEADYERLGERAEELTYRQAGRDFMRSKDGHCIALEQHGPYWLCSIHPIRPQLCRDFDRGCGVCHDTVDRMHPLAATHRKRLPVL